MLGAVAAAVSAALPAKAVLLHDAAHHDIIGGFGLAPIKAEGASIAYDLNEANFEEIGIRYAKALAKSMRQTVAENIAYKEHVAANVFERAFRRYEYRTFHTEAFHELVSGEGARRSVGGGGSPDRV